MKVININSENKNFYLVPRIMPNDGDIIRVVLRNEFKNIKEEVVSEWSYINNYFNIKLIDNDFYIINNRYEIEIFRDTTIIYKGKLYFTDIDDIQNFKLSKVTNNKIKI